MLKWKCCNLSYAQCWVCALITHFRAVPEVVERLADKELNQLILKAKSDNTDLFRNFAATIGAIPLTCDCQGAGKLHFFTVLLSALTFYTRQLSPERRARI